MDAELIIVNGPLAGKRYSLDSGDKDDADKWAKDRGGSVIDYADAQKAAANGLAGN
jgi:nitrous oxide reductase accessory protein NosL